MKRLLAGVVAIMLVLGGNVVLPNVINSYNFSFAASAEESGNFKYAVTNDGDAVLTGYTGSETDVTLPEIIDGHTVTGISYEFSLSNDGNNAVKIKRMVLSNSIKIVTDCAPGANMAELEEIVLNEGLEEFDPLFLQYSKVSDLTIPSTCKIASGTDIFTLSDLNLKSITIAEGNPYYKSVDGIVYSADMKIAEYCPFLYEKTSVIIPDGCEEISYGTFFGDAIKEITIPKSVTKIGEYAVGYHSTDGKDIGGGEHAAPQSPETYQFVVVPDFKIKCYSGSAAEQYAKDNGIDYELIDLSADSEYAEILYDEEFGRWYEKGENGEKLAIIALYDSDKDAYVTSTGKILSTTQTDITVNVDGEEYPDSLVYLVLSDNTLMQLINYGYSNNIYNDIKGKAVSAIGPYFDVPQALGTSVIIPDNITYLGAYAMQTRPNTNEPGDGIKEIVLSKNLLCIEEGGLRTSSTHEDGTLSNVVLPESLKYIGSTAFFGYAALTSITIPKNVEYIGDYAFGYTWDYDALNADEYTDADLSKYYRKIDGFTVYGYKGTEAESYATKNSFKFVALDADNSSDEKNNESGSDQSSSVDNNSNTSSQSTNNSTTGKSSTANSANTSNANTDNPNTGAATVGFGIAAIGGIAAVVAKRRYKK
ncbi:MAG: leucine-rich repeat protein [Ruminococcus sp.]|nr:leucine-rich repeat protein [Ruminococcus sp.]